MYEYVIMFLGAFFGFFAGAGIMLWIKNSIRKRNSKKEHKNKVKVEAMESKAARKTKNTLKDDVKVSEKIPSEEIPLEEDQRAVEVTPKQENEQETKALDTGNESKIGLKNRMRERHDSWLDIVSDTEGTELREVILKSRSQEEDGFSGLKKKIDEKGKNRKKMPF